MDILISNSSDKPIYEQICLQIKGLIMDGTLQQGEMLPSMRGLAKDLHISVNAEQRFHSGRAVENRGRTAPKSSYDRTLV